MNIYLLLKFLIKFADIGILFNIFYEVAILTQVKESKYDNYSPKILWVLYILDAKVFTRHLYKVFLANILINLSGDLEKNFKIDYLIKFLNKLVLIIKRD